MSKRNPYKVSVSVKSICIVCGIALLAAITAVIVLLNQSIISKPEKLNFSVDTDYVYTGTGFLYKRGKTLVYDDLSGKNSYTGDLPDANMKPAGYGADTHVIYSENSLCIVGLDKAVTPKGTIKYVECGKGYAACLTYRGGSEYIELYDVKGKLIEEIDPSNTIAQFGFTHKAKEELYIVAVDTDSETYVSTITTYDPAVPAMTGIITVQDQLVEDIVFTQKSIFAEGTANMIRYDASNNKESYRLITRGYHMGNYSVQGDKVYFIMHSDSDENQSVRMYVTSQSSVPSEEVLPVQVPNNTLEVFIKGSCVYAVTADKVYMYSKGGELLETADLGFQAEEVRLLNDGKLLLISRDSAYTCTVNGTNRIKSMFKK